VDPTPFDLTPPVIVAVDDDVIVASATAAPSTSGSAASDTSPVLQGFVTRLAHGNAAWTVPLSSAGRPAAIARSGDDAVVVVSAPSAETGVVLAKIGLDGTLRYESTLALEHENAVASGLAVDDDGAIFLAGGCLEGGTVEHVLFVKCDGDGTVLWEQAFTHSGTAASASAIAMLPGGDFVATGHFDDTLSFGGATDSLTSPALSPHSSGFIARFSPEGDVRWSSSFGGPAEAVGTALARVGRGYFLLAGDAVPDPNFHFGDQVMPSTPVVSSDDSVAPPAVLVALLDGQGKPTWLTLDQSALVADGVAVDAAGTVLVTGTLDASALNSVYLKTYDLSTGSSAGALRATGGGGVATGSISVATNGSVWLSGSYAGKADLGNQNLFETNRGGGYFVVRIEPE
jgi:hypothetical protein